MFVIKSSQFPFACLAYANRLQWQTSAWAHMLLHNRLKCTHDWGIAWLVIRGNSRKNIPSIQKGRHLYTPVLNGVTSSCVLVTVYVCDALWGHVSSFITSHVAYIQRKLDHVVAESSLLDREACIPTLQPKQQWSLVPNWPTGFAALLNLSFFLRGMQCTYYRRDHII